MKLMENANMSYIQHVHDDDITSYALAWMQQKLLSSHGYSEAFPEGIRVETKKQSMEFEDENPVAVVENELTTIFDPSRFVIQSFPYGTQKAIHCFEVVYKGTENAFGLFLLTNMKPPKPSIGKTTTKTITSFGDVIDVIKLPSRNSNNKGEYPNLQGIFLRDSVIEKKIVEFMHKYKPTRNAVVSWMFRTQHGMSQTEVQIDEPHKVEPVLYPWMNVHPEEYMKRFLESDSSILIMLGPPGTGKTNFLRNLMYKFKLKTMITYDSDLLNNDQLFIDFLIGGRGSNYDLLIMEDSDNMIRSRDESIDNHFVSKFLNVGDGLIKMPNKKMIFTANLTDFRQVDQALMRPGRCFDALEFRTLTFDEAEKISQKYGLPIDTSKKSFTLAEIFNPKTDLHDQKIAMKSKVGF